MDFEIQIRYLCVLQIRKCSFPCYHYVYIDDMLFISNNKDVIRDLNSQLSTQYDMKDFEVSKYILGMEIMRDRVNKMLWFNQNKCVKFAHQCFHMAHCRPLIIQIYLGINILVDKLENEKIRCRNLNQILLSP